jgi:N-acetylmuramic acid 6-phosphate etherase
MSQQETELTLRDVAGLDTWDDAAALDALLAGQERAIAAVRVAQPAIAAAATGIAGRLAAGGRLIYAGAGASIRIAVQDGSELPATFGMAEDRLVYLIAGGRAGLVETLAEAEDDAADGAHAAAIATPGDATIAVAASGTTPFTVAAARQAKARGALVVAMVNNADTPLGRLADVEISLPTGPEVIAGSTRMAAGTAQKAAFSLLSTLVHIKLGAVHDGLMVNLDAGNAKLRQRALGIVMRIAGVTEAQARAALDASGAIKPAIMLCAGAPSLMAAEQLLAGTNRNLRQALARLERERRL